MRHGGQLRAASGCIYTTRVHAVELHVFMFIKGYMNNMVRFENICPFLALTLTRRSCFSYGYGRLVEKTVACYKYCKVFIIFCKH